MTTGTAPLSAPPDPRYRQYADAAGIVNEQDGGNNSGGDGTGTGRDDGRCNDGSCLRRAGGGDAKEDTGGTTSSSRSREAMQDIGGGGGEHVAAQEELVEDAQNDFSIHDDGGFGGFGPSIGTGTVQVQILISSLRTTTINKEEEEAATPAPAVPPPRQTTG